MLRDATFAVEPISDGLRGQKRKTTQDCSSEPRLRSACNRCHAQKLRCLRSEGTEAGSKCDRCRRASVPCVYSPPNRIGRPARSGVTSATSSATSSRKEGRGSPRNPPQRSPPKSPQPQSPQQFFSSTHGSTMDPLKEDSRIFEDLHWDETNFKADLISFHHDTTPPPLVSSCTIFTENSSTPEEICRNKTISFTNDSSHGSGQEYTITEKSLDNYVRELTALGLVQYDQLRHLERMRNCTSGDRQGMFIRLHSYPIHNMLENVRKLTELISQLIPAPGFGGELLNVSPDLVSEVIPDLDPAIQSESTVVYDFLDLLAQPCSDISNSSTSYSGSSGGSSQLSPIASSMAPHIDTSTTLLVVSCYLRLAQSFALFFTDLHAFLLFSNITDPVPSEIPRLFPGLKLGLFQSYVGIGLEISIVVQVSERMLHRLHASLGLSCGQYTSDDWLNNRFPSSAWSNTETITPAMVRAIQVQERLDTQDEKGDTYSRLSLIIDGVKKLMKAQPFL
ncbi:hypothetical protein FQN49_005618 [Arthroderma sp. PD_2]|nr:hypothetical protein FQN49_005618 [Arthroderma sp. PD_2]